MRRYTDHAANERTWLAWIRTAIAIMAFGFIVERFELFSIYVHASLDGRDAHALVLGLNPLALVLMVTGMALILFSTVRFYTHQRMIERDEEGSYRTGLVAVSLAALLILVVVALILLAI